MQIQLPIKDSSFEGENWLPSSAFRLFSPALFSVQWVKLDYFFEPFIPRGKEDANETVSSFIKRRLGQEALDYAANPFISGVYASKPETLHLGSAFPFLEELEKKYRSIFLGMFRKKYSQAATQNQTNFLYPRDAPTN